MKETTLRAREKFLDMVRSYSSKVLFFKAMCFIAGIFVSKGSLFGHYHPFGLSISGAAPGNFFVPLTIGTAFGYLSLLRLATSVRYISALIAIAAIRWTLSDLKRVKNSNFYIPVLVFASSLITGISVNCAGNFEIGVAVVCVVESIIAGLAAHFFDRSHKILSRLNNYELSYKDLVYIAVSVSLILFSLEDIVLGRISVGRITVIGVILTAAYLLGTIGGAIFGIASSVICGMSNVGLTYLSGVYAFGGMMSGMCSDMGRLAMSGIFLVIHILFSMQSGDATKIFGGLYESIFAIMIFLIVPKSTLMRIKHKISVGNSGCRSDNLGQAVMQKLNFTSKFLNAVPKVIEKLPFDTKQNFRISLKSDYEMSVSKICCSCEKRGNCYGCYKSDTAENLKKAVESALNGVFESKNIFSKSFILRCSNSDSILNGLNEVYRKRLVEESADSRISYVKNAASQQLSAVSSLLGNISHEIGYGESFNQKLSIGIKDDLENIGIEVINISCRRNSAEKLFIDMELFNKFKSCINNKFLDTVSKSCGTELGYPVIMGLGNSFRVQICEKTKYKAEFFVAQHNCNGGKVCGDSYRVFEDGNGNFNIILSDGMGTGDLAAEGGEITAELMKNFIKAGMGFECSVKLVNSSIIMNSKDEALSTLDVMSLNLFNGMAKFMKAGAPFTYIVSGNNVKKLDFSSLPIGIFTDVTVSARECKLREGDTIVMLSDGVTDIGEEWIEEILQCGVMYTPKELASIIVNTAVRMRKSTHDDDITAVVTHVIKNKQGT